MARAPKYTIDNKKKVITADVAKLNEKEVKVLSKYLALGFTLEDNPAKQIYKKEYIKKYLKEKKIEGFDFDALTKEKNDKGKAKGYVYALKKFRAEFDDDFKKFMK